MSYLVFARKWRPKSFDDVVGQEHVTRTLKKAIEKDRVAHAYVFTGTRGVGKTTTARILARALNCEKGPTPDPCGECETCRTIMNGSSFDVLEIDGASNNSVEDIRELRDNINYSSMSGKHRIYVIDEVHMLSKSAFNALLKTLEEPPKNVIFIFATTEPRRIPETIMSRCQRYDFRRISPERILAQLEKICSSEKIAFDRSGLLLIARKADGSMRDALSLLDQVYSFCRDNIDEKEVRSVLGLVESEVYVSLMDAIAGKNVEQVLAAVHEALLKGYDLHEFLVGLEEHVRNLLFARIPGVLENEERRLQADITKQLIEQSNRFAEGDLLRMSELLRAAERDLRWSSYPRFLVEVALLKMLHMDSTVSVEQVLASLRAAPPDAVSASAGQDAASAVKKKGPPARVAYAVPGGEQPPAAVEEPLPPAARSPGIPPEHDADITSRPPTDDTPESFDVTEQSGAQPVEPGAMWRGFIESLMRDRPNLGSFMSMGSVASVRNGSVDLRFPANLTFQFSQVTHRPNRELIQKKLSEFWGRPVELHMSMETEKPGNDKEDKAPAAASMPPSLEDDMAQEPIIKTVIEAFDGDVL
ncbi:MAG: DNA polymerase III subunit gamma/tau [Chitinivibrionales bacterium]|nr:DNA polymerase III subunit gamma/tau [Chitinivibrionales bacterium]MBD3395771.1 DNA polymerase III subunit gamma/tau [Chitinivibrionales bacterium]